jgi:hypothetical protein
VYKRQEQLQSIDKQISDIKNNKLLDSDVIQDYKKYSNGIVKLDRRIIVSLVDRIDVTNDKCINIQFKFQDEIKKYSSIFADE